MNTKLNILMVVDLTEEQIQRIQQNVVASDFVIYEALQKEFNELYELITNDATTQENKISLKNYCIVRIVSGLEKILRQKFIELIDRHKFDYPEKIKVDSTILRQLRDENHNLTNGEIFANDINFQDLRNVAKAYDETLGNHFDVQKMHTEKNPDYDEIRKLIDLGIKERHKIAHDYQNTEFALKDIINFKRAVNVLILDWTEYIHKKMDEIRNI